MFDRYTKVVFVPQRRVCWDVVAQDVYQAVQNRILKPAQRFCNRIKKHSNAAKLAAVAGFCAAVATYQSYL